MPVFYGQQKNGVLWLPKALAEQRQRWLHSSKNAPVGEKLWIVREPKSWQQVKTIFGLAIATIKYHCDERGLDTATFLGLDVPTGIPVPASMIKEILYVACPIYDDDDNRITLSAKTADTANVSKFFTDIQAAH
jgi:hypothetical protein